MRKVQRVVEAGRGPDRARLEPSVLGGKRLAQVRLGALLEQETDIGQEGGLIVFGGELVVSAALLDPVAGQVALGARRC
ncbi:MAG: hypothetical protein ACFCVA_03175 [Gammaproteobacteria bacterium]